MFFRDILEALVASPENLEWIESFGMARGPLGWESRATWRSPAFHGWASISNAGAMGCLGFSSTLKWETPWCPTSQLSSTIFESDVACCEIVFIARKEWNFLSLAKVGISQEMLADCTNRSASTAEEEWLPQPSNMYVVCMTLYDKYIYIYVSILQLNNYI